MLCFWFLAFVVFLPPGNFLFDASRVYCCFPAPFLLTASVLFLLPGTFFVDGICFLLRVGLHIVRCLSVVFHSGSKHFGVRLPACLAMPKAGAKAKAAKILAGAEADEPEAAESADGDRTAATAAPQASVTESSAPDDNAFERLFEGDEAAPAVAKAGSTPATAAPAASQAEPKALSAATAVAKAGSTPASATPATAAPAVAKAGSTPATAAPAVAKAGSTPASATPKAGGHASSSAEPTVGSAAVDLDLPLIRRAAGLRTKYRKHDVHIHLPLDQVGFHPKNRDGQPPNGERCCQLADDIVRLGFDRDEADAGGVCVEQKPGTFTIAAFNLKACELDLHHAVPKDEFICFGTLSHSHIHQVLKNIRGGMKGTTKSIMDQHGNYSLVMLRAADPTFALVIDTGLLWEVLSWKMDVEEPDACSIIQAAMNAKGALFMLQHEMQAFARLCCLASAIAEQKLASTSVANSIVEVARRQLRQTLPQYADDEGFLHMYRFVVDLGASNESCCQDLLEFHQQFGIMNLLPLHMPHLRVAGIKHVYSCEPKFLKHGFCDNLSVKTVKEVLQKHSATAEFAELVMNWFHTHTRGLGPESFKVVSVLDRDVFGAVIGVRGEDRKTQVLRAASKRF